MTHTHTRKTHSHPYLTCERAWGSSLLCLDGWWPEDIMNPQTADRMKRRKRKRIRGEIGLMGELPSWGFPQFSSHYTTIQKHSLRVCVTLRMKMLSDLRRFFHHRNLSKRLSTLFTLTCLIFCASQSYAKNKEKHAWNIHKTFFVTERSNSDNLIGWCPLFCLHFN